MTWTEMKYDLKSVFDAVSSMLKEKYDNTDERGITFYKSNSGEKFSLHLMGTKPPWDFIVIDYESTGEDGEGFYPSDYPDAASMFAAMVDEIEH